jgi:release factor glutamine methyltransferase
LINFKEEAMEAKVWTIKALTEWTTKFLATKGVETPLKETRTLLAHVLACKPIDVVARSEEEPTPSERTRFKELIQRRADGWPTAYLTGIRDFYMLPFEVNPAVLIPRPDTEMLVIAALDFLKTQHAPQILDLGTGSGCIGVSLAHQLKSSHVTAIDISPDALDTAKRNATTHNVISRMTFHLGDLFAPLALGTKFDAILSNPPYIPPMELASLAVEVREHEPHIALDGGPDGLAFYRRIAGTAREYLAPGGIVAVEIGYNQGDAVVNLFRQAGFQNVQLQRDLSQRTRIVVAK